MTGEEARTLLPWRRSSFFSLGGADGLTEPDEGRADVTRMWIAGCLHKEIGVSTYRSKGPLHRPFPRSIGARGLKFCAEQYYGYCSAVHGRYLLHAPSIQPE